MYSFGEYFIECIPEHVLNDGWTVSARISRRSDYRRYARVPKVVYSTTVSELTRFRAERAGVEWAKAYITEHAKELENSLTNVN
jgi:hypothetical protein